MYTTKREAATDDSLSIQPVLRAPRNLPGFLMMPNSAAPVPVPLAHFPIRDRVWRACVPPGPQIWCGKGRSTEILRQIIGYYYSIHVH